MKGPMKYVLPISIVLSFLFMAFPPAGAEEANKVEGYDIQPPSREAGDLEVNGTLVLTENQIFKAIRFKDNGKLFIRGVRIVAEQIICRQENKNTSLVIDNGSFVSVNMGVMNVKADLVDIDKATITVDNNTVPAKVGESGKDSSLVLISKKANFRIENSTITVYGQNGAKGDPSTYGQPGGRAYLTLHAMKPYGLYIHRSEVKSLGGEGGDSTFPGMVAGPGGEARLITVGETVHVTNCPGAIGQTAGLRSQGGDAGSSSFRGNKGGFAEVSLRAEYDVIIRVSDIQSLPGSYTDPTGTPESRLVAKSVKGSFLIDHEKAGEARFQVLTVYRSVTTIIDAPQAVELHQVDVGESFPTPEGATTIKHYWWAFVWVRDRYGQNLEDASVVWFINDDVVPQPTDGSSYRTDQGGRVDIELVGRINSDRQKYKFEAEIYGQVKERSQEIVFENTATRQGLNRQVNINITRIDLTLTSVNGAPFTPRMVVGGVATFVGVAQSRSPVSVMERILLYEGDRRILNVTSTAPEGAPSYSTWEFKWDTETVSPGIHLMTLLAKDTLYEVTFNFEVEINQFAINHRPKLVSVEVEDDSGPKEPSVMTTVPVHVNSLNTVLKIRARAWEQDYRSDIITAGKGLRSAYITVRSSSGTLMYDRTMTDEELLKVNETGGYSLFLEVDVSKQKETLQDYPEGVYTINVELEDDAGYRSVDSWLKIDLSWDYYPLINIFLENEELPTLSDPVYIEPTWVLETEESHKRRVVFNFTKCTDEDSPNFLSGRSYEDLTMTVSVQLEGETETVIFGPEKGKASFPYDFNVKDVPDEQEGIFTIRVTAVDGDGLSQERIYRSRVTHDPPPLPNSILGAMLGQEDMGIGLGAFVYLFPILFAVGIGVYLGLMFLNMRKANADRSKKIDLLEKMKAEEKKQQKSVIEDEIRSGATKGAAIFSMAQKANTGLEAAQPSPPTAPVQPSVSPPRPQAPAAPAPAPAVSPVQVTGPVKQVPPAAPSVPRPPSASVPPAPPRPPVAPPVAPKMPPIPPVPKPPGQ